MELQELNNLLDEELDFLNEGFRDIVSSLWNKVKGVKQQTMRAVAQKFFQKHPELLQAVKAKLGIQTSEAIEILDEATAGQKGLMTVAIILALLGGIVKPASASEPVTLKDASTGITQTQFITNMSDALEKMDTSKFIDGLVGSYVVDSGGNYTFVDDKGKAQSVLKAAGGNYDDVIIFSPGNLEGTGGVSGPERSRGMAFQRHITGAGTGTIAQR